MQISPLPDYSLERSIAPVWVGCGSTEFWWELLQLNSPPIQIEQFIYQRVAILITTYFGKLFLNYFLYWKKLKAEVLFTKFLNIVYLKRQKRLPPFIDYYLKD